MIRAVEKKSFELQRNESNENTICEMAVAPSLKTGEEPTWVQYRRLAGLVSPKKQQQHFVPVVHAQTTSEGKKSISSPMRKKKTLLRSDSPSNHRSSSDRVSLKTAPETPSSWSNKVKMAKRTFAGRTGLSLSLPMAPLVDSSGSALHVVKMDDFATQRNNSKWMNDDSLLNTPVFQKRVRPYAILIQKHVRRLLAKKSFKVMRENRAATAIQRIFRGHGVRKEWLETIQNYKAAKAIQKYARGFMIRRSLTVNRAAVVIQRCTRGYLGRLVGQMKKLEKQLTEIRADHAMRLQKIELDKQAFFSEVGSDSEQDTKEKNSQLAQDTIVALRESNRRLREDNKRLMADSHELVQERKRMEQTTAQCLENINFLKTTIRKLVSDQQHLKVVIGEFEKKFEEVVEKAKHIDDMIAFERKICKVYIARIKDQITIINSVCRDKELAESIRIEALHGLEASKATLDESVRKAQCDDSASA